MPYYRCRDCGRSLSVGGGPNQVSMPGALLMLGGCQNPKCPLKGMIKSDFSHAMRVLAIVVGATILLLIYLSIKK